MRKTSILFFAITLGTATSASAAEFEYEIRAGWGLSDNIGLITSNETDEEFTVVDLRVEGGHQTRKVDFDVDADVGFRHYSGNSYDDQVVGSLGASLDLGIVPDVFVWRTSDNFGTFQRDPFRPITPDNLENVNNFSTGPELQIRFGKVMSLVTSAHYRRNKFELSKIDNDVVGGEMALVRTISLNREVSLNLSADRVEYDNSALGSSLDRQAAYVSFSSQMSRGSIAVAFGVNELHDRGVTEDGIIGSVSLERELSPRTQLTLYYDQRLSDAGDIFFRFQDPGGKASAPRQITGAADPFESKRFRLGLDHARKTSDWNWALDISEEDYFGETALNRRRYSLSAGMAKKFAAGWRARLEGQLLRTDLYNAGREDDDLDLTFGLSKQIGRNVDVDIAYGFIDRQSTDPADDYQENRVTITLGYSSSR